METDKIRVLIVDDSALMREALKLVLEQDPSIEVIGMAKDGKEGVDKAFALKPNVITMDLKMPILSGIEAIEKIMEEMPIPVIVVSSMDTSVIVKALSIGAMDFVAVTGDIETISIELVEKIKIASRIKPLRRIKVKPYVPPATRRTETRKDILKVIAIGVSTGGPQALEVLLSKLPKDMSCGVLVVQHMSKGFINGLAEWLGSVSRLEVRVAKSGEKIQSGVVLLAPDDYNMSIDENGFIYLKESIGKTALHVPSIDAMMISVAESYKQNAVGIIMTGMGQDGVEGIRAIKRAGGRTIAQDERTSVVFGMNKVAIDSGYIDIVAPLIGIADEIVRIAQDPR